MSPKKLFSLDVMLWAIADFLLTDGLSVMLGHQCSFIFPSVFIHISALGWHSMPMGLCMESDEASNKNNNQDTLKDEMIDDGAKWEDRNVVG